MTISDRIKSAEASREESFRNNSISGVSYWDGYIDALKAVKEETEQRGYGKKRKRGHGMSKEDFEGIKQYAKEQHAKRVADNPNRVQYAIQQFEKHNIEYALNTVRAMQSEIKDRCIKGGIYPAFVARTIDQIAKEMLEGNQ